MLEHALVALAVFHQRRHQPLQRLAVGASLELVEGLVDLRRALGEAILHRLKILAARRRGGLVQQAEGEIDLGGKRGERLQLGEVAAAELAGAGGLQRVRQRRVGAVHLWRDVLDEEPMGGAQAVLEILPLRLESEAMLDRARDVDEVLLQLLRGVPQRLRRRGAVRLGAEPVDEGVELLQVLAERRHVGVV